MTSHVRFLGHRPDAASLLHHADLVWLGSEFEGMSNSLMEAMACGVPALTTYSGAIPEIVEDAALLCQPNDFVSLTEQLARLVREPELRSSLAEKGAALARRRYDLKDYAAGLGAVYMGLVNAKMV